MVSLRKKFFIAAVIVVAAFGVLFAYKAGRTITVISGSEEEFWKEVASGFAPLPKPEKNRIDILILGIRGYDGKSEWGNGEWLADTIILVSLNTLNNQAAIISIPRDLYVNIPGHGKDKINAAYAIGETRNRNGGGLQLTKTIASMVTGAYVDHAASIDFRGFGRIIDQLGGITIYRNTPFVESKQWLLDGREGKRYWRLIKSGSATSTATSTEASVPVSWEFYVPAGTNVMDSEEALYYARSRYSSSDFDRMRRQQEVIDAVKSKALNLGVLANPFQLIRILDTLEKDVRTDMSLREMKDLAALAAKLKIQEFRRAVLDSSENGLLVEDKVDGLYVLLPKSGDYQEIQRLIREIVQ